MKKWIIVAVVLAGGAWGFQKWRAALPGAGALTADAQHTTAAVENRDIHFAVSAAGEIGPADQVSVRPEINGKILTLPVDIGDRVKKDSVLFTLDDQDLQTDRSSKLIEIEAAKLQLEKARRDYERSKQLFADKLISQELFEDTRTQYELARNSLDRTEKALHLVEYQLTKTKILAPFDCTVLTRPVSVGQAVSGSGGFNSGTEVATIANLNEMVINAHINQADVTRLKIGQQVEVQVEAVAGLKITGTVERIAPQATIKNNIKGFAARILLKDVDPRVRPGMTANVQIPVASADNVMAVPLAAVFTETNPETGQTERYVYVKTEEGFERRPVQIGVSDYFYAEIQNGLSPGERVALELPETEKSRAVKNPLVMLPVGSEGGGTVSRPGASKGSDRTNAAGGARRPGGNRRGGT
ncbi:MAG TPA: efflux RND transporter periplasmic adaptor subunit [Haliangiales bacterium]|nr:efflux RND transporter periplasmic adaptor subunit [Haliangiales bacterium]